MKILLAFCAFSLCAHGVSAEGELLDMQLESITAGGASASAIADARGTHASSSTNAIAEVRVGGGKIGPGAARAFLGQVSIELKASATADPPAAKPSSASAQPSLSAAAGLITRFRNSR